MKKVRVVAYIPREMNEELETKSYRDGVSKSKIIKKALAFALNNEFLFRILGKGGDK